MALNEPYCTIAEADTFLVGSEVWAAADDPTKQNALFWGRTYLDSSFKCPDLVEDPAAPSETVKYANALLAEDYLEGTLFPDSGEAATGKEIASETKTAGAVSKSVSYFEGKTTKGAQQSDVRQLLTGSGECTANSSGMKKLARN